MCTYIYIYIYIYIYLYEVENTNNEHRWIALFFFFFFFFCFGKHAAPLLASAYPRMRLQTKCACEVSLFPSLFLMLAAPQK